MFDHDFPQDNLQEQMNQDQIRLQEEAQRRQQDWLNEEEMLRQQRRRMSKAAEQADDQARKADILRQLNQSFRESQGLDGQGQPKKRRGFLRSFLALFR